MGVNSKREEFASEKAIKCFPFRDDLYENEANTFDRVATPASKLIPLNKFIQLTL